MRNSRNYGLVDTHVHLWDQAHGRHSWLASVPAINRPFVIGDYQLATRDVGVDGIVFVEAGADAGCGLVEAEWVTSLAREEPRIKGIVAQANLGLGDAAREYLEALARLPLVKGVRSQIPFQPDAGYSVEEGFVKGLRIAHRLGFNIDVCIGSPHLRPVAQLAERFPETRFVLDHSGNPNIKGRALEPWKSDLAELACHPNAHCKVSGLTTCADMEHWKKEDLKPYIDHVLACFGPDRALYGSDWPVSTMATEYPRWAEAVEWAVESLTETERRKFLRDNAIRVYRLDLAAES